MLSREKEFEKWCKRNFYKPYFYNKHIKMMCYNKDIYKIYISVIDDKFCVTAIHNFNKELSRFINYTMKKRSKRFLCSYNSQGKNTHIYTLTNIYMVEKLAQETKYYMAKKLKDTKNE